MRRRPQSSKAKSEKLKLKRAQNRGIDVALPTKQVQEKFSRSKYLNPALDKKKKAAEKLESTWKSTTKQQKEDEVELKDNWLWHRPISIDQSIWLENDKDLKFTCFKRPKWNYKMSKKELESNENIQFKRWLKYTDELLDNTQQTYFSVYERNLEVWRQFWRTCEMSSILLILIDVRLPSIHFTNSLKSYLNILINKQNKRIIYVFTKVDLVPKQTTDFWFNWLKSQLNDTDQIVKLSSYQIVTGEQGKGRRKPFIQPESLTELLVAISNAYHSLKSSSESLPDINFDERQEESADHNDNKPDSIHTGKADKRKARKLGRIQAESNKGGPKRRGFDDTVNNNNESENEDGGTSQEKRPLEFSNNQNELTIGLIGQPNVGKSSVINGLFGKSKVRASSTPGKTKHFQTLYLTDQIRLADCPGLIWPSTTPRWAQVLGSTVPISQERQPSGILYAIGQRMPLEHVLPLAPESVLETDIKEDKRTWREGMVRTEKSLDKNIKVLEILERYAIRAGFMTAKAGRPDINRASNYILRQITTSQYSWAYLPPGTELNENPNGIYISSKVIYSSDTDEESAIEESENEKSDLDETLAEDSPDEADTTKSMRTAFDLLNVDLVESEDE
ncbi:P-loop containing nucleoside triphosphate hydrolase protein [Wallemia mellicola]|nr:P-loop containing nucleoside triphosphate hydrolase protein [Wallemia mellicola]